MRAVVDTNVFVAGVLSPRGTCGDLLRQIDAGQLKPVVSPKFLSELGEVLGRRKFQKYIPPGGAQRFVRALESVAEKVRDPVDATEYTRDPKDNYLVALARASGAEVIVSGDRDLTDPEAAPAIGLPVIKPADALAELPRLGEASGPSVPAAWMGAQL